VILTKKLKVKVMEVMKMLTVHRSLGANRGLSKVMGTAGSLVEPSMLFMI